MHGAIILVINKLDERLWINLQPYEKLKDWARQAEHACEIAFNSWA